MSKYCPNCNFEMPDEANFCLNCMTPFESSNSKNADIVSTEMADKKSKFNCFSVDNIKNFLSISKSKLAENKKKTAAFSVAALCAVFMIIFGSVSLANSNSTQPNLLIDNNKSEEVSDKKENKLSTFVKDILGVEDDEGSNEANAQNVNNNNDNGNSSKIDNSITSDNQTSTKVTNHINSTQGSGSNNATTSGNASSSQSQNSNISNSGNTSETVGVPAEVPSTEVSDFNFELSSNGQKYYITGYKGNDTVVTIPAKYNGKYISQINSKAFQNSNIEYVYFESDENQSSISLYSSCFYNCWNLKKITFPKTALSISSGFASNCPNLSSLGGLEDNNSFKFENGCLYYNTGSTYKLRFICPGANIITLDIPSWCSGFESSVNLSENYQIRTINMHKNCTSFPDSYMKNNCLESVNIESGNSHAISESGILFSKSSSGKYQFTFYPNQNKTRTFKIPENVTFNVYSGSPVNAYLETLYIPKSVTISGQDRIANKKAFTNLKTIYVQSGSQYEDYFKKNFNGTVKTY